MVPPRAFKVASEKCSRDSIGQHVVLELTQRDAPQEYISAVQ
ncbi:hypothetical protein SAMN05216274_11416 [Cryobacterium levicorallinum]|uniref:Uncharacterized protein n=1 Tax=Cryobacterium levicorallinum TaxID=995038 RepID=A0ABY1EGF2_9MICO|nr:hypothetical protein SAMN05216274_11416 [Cryobacterium levicorallinum]